MPHIVNHAVHIPFFPHAMLIGLFGGELTIPAAVITLIIMACI